MTDDCEGHKGSYIKFGSRFTRGENSDHQIRKTCNVRHAAYTEITNSAVVQCAVSTKLDTTESRFSPTDFINYITRPFRIRELRGSILGLETGYPA